MTWKLDVYGFHLTETNVHTGQATASEFFSLYDRDNFSVCFRVITQNKGLLSPR